MYIFIKSKEKKNDSKNKIVPQYFTLFLLQKLFEQSGSNYNGTTSLRKWMKARFNYQNSKFNECILLSIICIANIRNVRINNNTLKNCNLFYFHFYFINVIEIKFKPIKNQLN